MLQTHSGSKSREYISVEFPVNVGHYTILPPQGSEIIVEEGCRNYAEPEVWDEKKAVLLGYHRTTIVMSSQQLWVLA